MTTGTVYTASYPWYGYSAKAGREVRMELVIPKPLIERKLNVATVADKLGISKYLVVRAIERGEMKAVNVGAAGKRHYRVRIDDLNRYIRTHVKGHAPAE